MCRVAIINNGGEDALKYIQNIPEEVQIYCIKNMTINCLKYIKSFTVKSERLAYYFHGYHAFHYFLNPSEEICTQALLRGDLVIMPNIKKPSIKLQMHLLNDDYIFKRITKSENLLDMVLKNEQLDSRFLYQLSLLVEDQLKSQVKKHRDYKNVSTIILDHIL